MPDEATRLRLNGIQLKVVIRACQEFLNKYTYHDDEFFVLSNIISRAQDALAKLKVFADIPEMKEPEHVFTDEEMAKWEKPPPEEESYEDFVKRLETGEEYVPPVKPTTPIEEEVENIDDDLPEIEGETLEDYRVRVDAYFDEIEKQRSAEVSVDPHSNDDADDNQN